MPKALVATGLRKTYGRQHVLLGVDLVVGEGEMVLIQGENGVGKTTLLRILAGREKPDTGRVLYYGRSLASEKSKRFFALSRLKNPFHPVRSPQSARAFTSLTVSECFDLIDGEASAATRAGFEKESATTAGSISGGRRKALSVALALGTGGKVIVLDEPEAGLDSENIDRLAETLVAAKARGQTMVVSAHEPSHRLKELADRTYWMHNSALHSKPQAAHAKQSAFSPERKSGVPDQGVDLACLKVSNLLVQRNGTTVLENLSFSIEPGRALSVSGPNGSGKSSLALALAGLVSSQGVIGLGDHRLDGLSPADRARLGVSLMPQAPQGIFMDLTVGENLRAVARDSHRSVFFPEFILSVFPELAELQDEQARRLSGGFQRILSLAMTLRRGTLCMILDEPLAGLGAGAAEKVVEVLHWLSGRVTILVLEHRKEVMRAAGFDVVELAALGRGKSG